MKQLMCSYKGNVGHLMQHWALCELLNIAGKHTSGLNFIDAHAMAPWATERDVWDVRFNHVRDHLPGQRSTYERTWHRLAQNRDQQGYPNSAAFVNEIWEGEFSLLLCETDGRTIKEIDAWLPDVLALDRCKRARRFHGDWRTRFAAGLASRSADGLSDKALTLVSLDPNMYNRIRGIRLRGGARTNRSILYSEDIEKALCEMSGLEGGILIQLSTYSSRSTGNQYTKGQDTSNRQEDVVASVDAILAESNFESLAEVKANNRMMSLVYGRDVSWSDELKDLGDRFNE